MGLGIFGVLIGSLVYMLFSDPHSDQDPADLSFGKVIKVKNDVQRRPVSDLSWQPIDNHTFLFENDTILTGENSAVKIRLVDGEEISAEENTLFRLTAPQKEKDLVALILKKGRFKVKLHAKSRFQMDSHSISSNGSNTVVVEALKNNKIKIVASSKGVSVLSNKTGKARKLGADTPLILMGEKIQIPKVSSRRKKSRSNNEFVIPSRIRGPKVSMLGPKPGSRHSGDTPVLFHWKKHPTALLYFWQVAKDEEFLDVVDSGETFETEIKVANLPTERLYWRVQGQDADGFPIPEQEIRIFRVTDRAPSSDFDVSTRKIPVLKGTSFRAPEDHKEN